MKNFFRVMLPGIANQARARIVEFLTVFFLSACCLLLHGGEAGAASFSGSLKGVSITDAGGTNAPPVAKFTQFETSSSPLTVQFDAGASSDPNGTVAEYHWDFGDGTVGIGKAASHTFADANLTYQVTLTVVDDKGAVALSQVQVKKTFSFSLFVNFQPWNVPIPAGFVLDSGAGYNATQKYGWVVLPTSQGTFDSNSTISPSQEYDTMIHVVPTAKWEAEVASGSYEVTVVMGDAIFATGTENVQIEGVPLIQNEKLSSTVKWIEKKAVFQVNDGRLTMTFVGSTNPARLCFIKIASK